ncbi:fructosamine kinase family protein [Thalassospira alkalitolerans]|uniref:fructosamine kinase family protein n=1 Tax=Thalassospira alkalitolerans TaxID=1293890 RepID=UPI003AA87F65
MPLLTTAQRIADIAGCKVATMRPLSGGCVADVTKVGLTDGRNLVVKLGDKGDLAIESRMLKYLAKHSPVPSPKVLHGEQDLLIMEFIENDGHSNRATQCDLAVLLAGQHQITQDQFGLSFGTLIGGLPQPNPLEKDWITFFRDHRLLYMANLATKRGQLPVDVMPRIEKFAAKLGDLLPSDTKPSLLHGDLWGGNILYHKDRIAGLIDPAIYYGDREIELAFGTLFGDLTPDFFEKYSAILPIYPGFHEERRDIYNLYPLLVHVCLFGGSYVGSVGRILTRFGV